MPRSGDAVVARLSLLDRWLPVWIAIAMGTGLILGAVFPGVDDLIDSARIDTVSLPIAVGLLAMMYPVLAKVRYGRIKEEVGEKKVIVVTLLFNWVVGPLLMFVLAWTFLPDRADLRTGIIIVGIAPCIAMVMIWNDLAFGNREVAAALVAINALIQIAAFALYAWLLLEVLPGALGWDTTTIDVTPWEIARSVIVFLGIPLVAGWASRRIGERRKGADWYDGVFLPRIGPVALYGLLFTIVCLFAMQGDRIIDDPLEVARVALPLAVFFAVMWSAGFVVAERTGLSYDKAVTVAFTAAGNNFELAIAVCIAVFGVGSGQALAGTIGPLIEVPALVALVYVALWARRRFPERG